MNYKVEPVDVVDLRHSLYECWPRIVWQKLFDLYRANGGDLTKLDNLLIDYDNCKEWIKPERLSDHVVFGFEASVTTWKFTDRPEDWYWNIATYDNLYSLTLGEDYVTIKQIKEDG